jgi:anti-anti-sigma factor
MSETPNPTPAPTPAATIERIGAAVVAHANLKMLDDNELKQLGQMVDQAAGAAGVTVVVLDLARVQILPSLGLGALIQMSNKCKARQQRFKLAAVTHGVRQVLSITRLDRVLDLSDTVEAAVE